MAQLEISKITSTSTRCDCSEESVAVPLSLSSSIYSSSTLGKILTDSKSLIVIGLASTLPRVLLGQLN
jgi:hypothetical protein